jgi:methionyl-tRNA synthetase
MPRILITSALPYINGIKHLGNLAGSMLPADVYARFKRAQGHEVLYICATDEHGTPAELAAAAAGQDVRTYCDEQHEVQKAAGQAFGLSYDWFGRSSNAPNQRLTQHFAAVLEKNGLIEERVDRMIYSVDDARFLDRQYTVWGEVTSGMENVDKIKRGEPVQNPDKIVKATVVSGGTLVQGKP